MTIKGVAIWFDHVYAPLAVHPSSVRCGQILFLSGQIAWDPARGLLKGFFRRRVRGACHTSGDVYLATVIL